MIFTNNEFFYGNTYYYQILVLNGNTYYIFANSSNAFKVILFYLYQGCLLIHFSSCYFFSYNKSSPGTII